MTKNEFEDICVKVVEGNICRIRLLKIEEIEPGTKNAHKIITYAGGNNSGWSDWKEYLMEINSIFFRLKKKLNSEHLWLIDLVNDCMDDVFYLRIGTRIKLDEER